MTVRTLEISKVLSVSSVVVPRDFLLSASHDSIWEDIFYTGMTGWSERKHQGMVISEVVFKVYIILIQVRQASE
jgi:hypothetical protein